jgi:Fe-S oxidoreductase
VKALGADVPVKTLDGRESCDVLYFTDSMTAYDDRAQDIARSTARVLSAVGVDFGILGSLEKDSGHEVRRFGEELLFTDLREVNSAAIRKSRAKQIVTSDPHAFNALKNDYAGIPPVAHTSQLLARAIRSGDLRFKSTEAPEAVCVYHDSCYLGRHNGIYDAPREVLDAVPALKRVEMARSMDRSFCCGGGGLNLFYEPREEKRMAHVRIDMAMEAGADLIVTACPFCLVHFEDGIKTMGLEGKMAVIDLMELVDRQLQRTEVG